MPPSSASALRHVTVDRAAAFTDLFEAHWSAVHAYAHRRIVPAADAHDVAAETFTVAWRRFDDVPVGHELPWLYRTAANVLANRARGDRRRGRLSAKLAGQPRADRADAADEAIEDLALAEAFSGLRDDDAEILMLVAWEGLSTAEVGAVLGISANAAALRVSRARARLADALDAIERADVTDPAHAGHEVDDRTGPAGPEEGSTR